MTPRRLRALATAVLAISLSLVAATPAQAAVSERPDTDTVSFNGAVRTVLSVGDVTYVGGDFTAATLPSGTSVPRSRIAAVNTATGQLLPFNPRANGPVWSLAAAGGTIYLGGSFSNVGGAARTNIAKVTTTGALTPFSPRVSARVRALAVADGTLYAGGEFLQVNGAPRARLASFAISSGALTGWDPTANRPVYDLLATASRVYVAGAFDSIDQLTRAASLASLDPGSGAVQAWNPAVGYPVRALATDGSRIYAAAEGQGGHLRAFTSATGADVWEVTADGDFQAVSLINGVVYFGGHLENICRSDRTGSRGACLDGQISRHKIGAVRASDGALTPFDPQARGGFLGVFDLDSANGRLSAGGVFRSFLGGSVPRPFFATFS